MTALMSVLNSPHIQLWVLNVTAGIKNNQSSKAGNKFTLLKKVGLLQRHSNTVHHEKK